MPYVVPDDYPTIQDAINAGSADEDIEVLIRPDIYTLNPEFNYPPNQIIVRPRLTLRGEGLAQRDSTIIKMSPPDLAASMRKDVITSIGDVNDLTVQDLTIDQQAVPDNLGSSVVYLRGGVNRNINFRRLRVLNGFGGGLIAGGTNILMEDNIIEKVWTGITFAKTDGFIVRRNDIRNTVGNAVYPQRHCINGLIENNYLESAGDCAVDVTSNAPNPPNDNIVVKDNEIVNGHIRVTNSVNIHLYRNKMQHGYIVVDSGQAVPINVKVEENEILTDKAVAIRFAGAQKCDAIGNKIRMLPPLAAVDKQIGMVLAVRGLSTIKKNEVVNARDYAMSFGGWGLGGDSNMTILDNKLMNFGDVGIYDDGLSQGSLKVLRNSIFSELSTARWGVLTDMITNKWLIEGNALKVGELVADAAISAPNSTLLDNTEFTPELSILTISPIILGIGLGTGIGYIVGGNAGAAIGTAIGATFGYTISRYVPPVLNTTCIKCGVDFTFTTPGTPVWCPYCNEEQVVSMEGVK